MSGLTNKAIIAQAKAGTRMIYSGRMAQYELYRLHDWDNKRNAWIESSSQYFYQSAKRYMREHYIDNVLHIVFSGNPQCLYNRYHVEDYQDWRTFARIIINTARENCVGIFSEND